MLALCSPLSNLRISQKLYPRYPLRLETCGIDLHLSEVAKRIRILGWVVVAVAARRPRVGRYKDALAMRANAQTAVMRGAAFLKSIVHELQQSYLTSHVGHVQRRCEPARIPVHCRVASLESGVSGAQPDLTTPPCARQSYVFEQATKRSLCRPLLTPVSPAISRHERPRSRSSTIRAASTSLRPTQTFSLCAGVSEASLYALGD